YIMLTCRAEQRILIRQENADIRLYPLAYKIGLIDKERYKKVVEKEKQREEIVKVLQKKSVDPKEVNPLLEQVNSSPINQKTKYINLVSRPQLGIQSLEEAIPDLEKELN